MDTEKIIEQLFLVLEELYAREVSNNCPTTCLRGFSWNELCDMCITQLQQLKN